MNYNVIHAQMGRGKPNVSFPLYLLWPASFKIGDIVFLTVRTSVFTLPEELTTG
jgi:hypothetical protein